MKLTRLAGLLAVALTVGSTALYAAGNYSTYPIVEGSSFCASTVGVNGQQGNTGQGGGAAGTAGAYCAQTVQAGPTAVTGSELIPADTALANGAPPQTVVLQMANLNALPLSFTTVLSQTITTFNATSLQGGVILHSTNTMTKVTVNLPPAPIDGQQFAIAADQTVTTLIVSSNTFGAVISQAPTVLTVSTTAPYGYRYEWNAANTQWTRLQ